MSENRTCDYCYCEIYILHTKFQLRYNFAQSVVQPFFVRTHSHLFVGFFLLCVCV